MLTCKSFRFKTLKTKPTSFTPPSWIFVEMRRPIPIIRMTTQKFVLWGWVTLLNWARTLPRSSTASCGSNSRKNLSMEMLLKYECSGVTYGAKMHATIRILSHAPFLLDSKRFVKNEFEYFEYCIYNIKWFAKPRLIPSDWLKYYISFRFPLALSQRFARTQPIT